MFERPVSGERAVLVSLQLRSDGEATDLEEFRELVLSAGVTPAGTLGGRRDSPDPRQFLGAGKLEELRQCLESTGAETVLFNHDLTPGQERNLEKALGHRVVDRTGVILDIFAQRAQTFEGKLQVELAQLQHLSTRLVRGWTHLERQRGGIGLRGPGETQLETDRRLVARRIRQINRRLERVRAQRGQGRRARRRAELPVVSLVGYTNAGKSTLFNRLTGAGVLAADRLFATLDPTLRRLDVKGLGPVLLSDTVGFIRHLPHDLVAAFRATLEEVADAELLLHVIDASDPEHQSKAAQTREVVAEIGAGDLPTVEVYNKIDALGEGRDRPRIDRDPEGTVQRVWLSAALGTGLDALVAAVAERLGPAHRCLCLSLPPSAARLRARLYAADAVLAEQPEREGGWRLDVRLTPTRLEALCRESGLDAQALCLPPGPGTGGAGGKAVTSEPAPPAGRVTA